MLGDHPRDWHERHRDGAHWLDPATRALLHRPYVGCNYNSPAGMTLPSRAWSTIRQSAAAYCDRTVNAYDDAIHALQNAPPAGHQAAWLGLLLGLGSTLTLVLTLTPTLTPTQP